MPASQFLPKVMESSDETTRRPVYGVHRTARAPLGPNRKHRNAQRLPLADARIETVADLREYHRIIKVDKVGGFSRFHLPDFPRIDDGVASLPWGKAMARDFVRAMVQCRRQTQVPAVYIAEKMGVAPEIVYRLERNESRGVKLDTVLRYLYSIGLEIEIVEFEEQAK